MTYKVKGNVVTVTGLLSMEGYKLLKSLGYIIKFIC
jgi:hypothetical protein